MNLTINNIEKICKSTCVSHINEAFRKISGFSLAKKKKKNVYDVQSAPESEGFFWRNYVYECLEMTDPERQGDVKETFKYMYQYILYHAE